MHFNKGNLTSLKNLVLWQRPWLKKSTTTEPQKLPTLFSYISLPKCFIASEVFVEQAIHIQKLCLSPSHYETACIAGRISRQVRRFLGSGRKHVNSLAASPLASSGSSPRKYPGQKIPSALQANYVKDFFYRITISSRHQIQRSYIILSLSVQIPHPLECLLRQIPHFSSLGSMAFWLLSNKGGRRLKNREEIGAGATWLIFLAASPLVRPALQNRHATQAITSRARVMIKCPGEGMLKLWI